MSFIHQRPCVSEDSTDHSAGSKCAESGCRACLAVCLTGCEVRLVAVPSAIQLALDQTAVVLGLSAIHPPRPAPPGAYGSVSLHAPGIHVEVAVEPLYHAFDNDRLWILTTPFVLVRRAVLDVRGPNGVSVLLNFTFHRTRG